MQQEVDAESPLLVGHNDFEKLAQTPTFNDDLFLIKLQGLKLQYFLTMDVCSCLLHSSQQQSKVKLSVRDLGCATYQKLLLHDLVQSFKSHFE